MVERCPRCELRFERVEGHWLGSLGLNVMVSFAALFVVLVVGFVVTYPEPPVGPLIAIGLVVALVLPLVFFPFSKTLWTAIDVLMRPLHPDEVRPEYRILDRE
jgi:Na+/phosphate symporter